MAWRVPSQRMSYKCWWWRELQVCGIRLLFVVDHQVDRLCIRVNAGQDAGVMVQLDYPQSGRLATRRNRDRHCLDVAFDVLRTRMRKRAELAWRRDLRNKRALVPSDVPEFCAEIAPAKVAR